jgi:hypothetical protein
MPRLSVSRRAASRESDTHRLLRAASGSGGNPSRRRRSHHVGRWRLFREIGGSKLASSLVDVIRGEGTFLFHTKELVGPHTSSDPDTERIWWRETGVNQNLTFPVQPDPVSGMHCWHQKVTLAPAHTDDRHADVFVDTRRSREVYEEWKKLARPAPGPGGLRRPLWLNRPLKPTPDAYRMP